MVIDTSALLAMLGDEPEAEELEAAVEADNERLMSTATYLETAIVIETRFGEPGGRELDLWLHRAAVDLVNVAPAKPKPRESRIAGTAKDDTARA